MSDYLSDVTLVISNVEIRAHKQILAARSPKFSQLIEESVNDTIKIEPTVRSEPSIEVDAFKLFLQYIYTGKIITHVQTVCTFYELALMFGKAELARRLECFIDSHLAELLKIRAHHQLSSDSLWAIIHRMSDQK
jgi:hypothetical protein